MAERSDLVKNLRECVAGGESEEAHRRYRNAVELYYKAFVALCDVIILDIHGELPDYHKRRGEILSRMNGHVNRLRIGVHTLYRRSYYRSDFSASDCREIKNAIKTVSILRRPGKEIEAIAQAL